MNSFFLSVSFPRTRREVPSIAGRKGQVCVHRSKFLMYLLQFAPSVNLTVDTLAKVKSLTHFCSVALLPGRWFACFPTNGDGLRLAFFPLFPSAGEAAFLYESFHYFGFFLIYKNYEFFFP